MKTTKRSNPSLPSPFKFSVYIFAVAVLCFINWTALRAGNPAVDIAMTLEESLADALIEESDLEMQLEDWMLSISENFLAETTEQEIALESWMLTFPAGFFPMGFHLLFPMKLSFRQVDT